jgi:hypothetical protein
MTIDCLHVSELAHWPKAEEALTALLAAVPSDGLVILESTPCGTGNLFHRIWQQAKLESSDWHPHLFTWFEDQANRLPGPPLGQLTPHERELQQRHGLDDDQLRWRRAKERDFGDRLPQEFVEDDVTCFLTAGRCCFPVSALLRMRDHAQSNPGTRYRALLLPARGRRPSDQRVPVAPGTLTIWRTPEEGRDYSIGADAAAGVEGGDFSAAVVIERDSGEQVCELCGRWQPHLFARLLAALGYYYNNARLAVENDQYGFAVLVELRRELFYGHLYHYRDYTAKRRDELGWPTNSRTRPLMIADLGAALAEGAILMRSPELIAQCLNFVIKEGGRQEALEGSHDDLVVAACIAWQVRKQPVARWSTQRPLGM